MRYVLRKDGIYKIEVTGWGGHLFPDSYTLKEEKIIDSFDLYWLEKDGIIKILKGEVRI